MSSSATTAVIGESGTTPVVTGTVRPVNRSPAPRGSNGAGRTCCPPSTSTSSSPSPAVAEVATQNKAVVYGLLFRAVADTLRTIAADPRHLGAEIGFFAVLHTWGQTLVHHPHLHCVIPGGGLASDGSGWVACRPGFFLPVRVLSRYFRRVLLQALQDAFESGQLRFAGRLQPLGDPRRFAEHLRPARETDWVVYAKRPFAGPKQVLDYLGRYTHRIAIGNQRLCSLDSGSVRFRYADYRRAGASRQRTMTLTATEFIRRMLLHVVPPGFHRIRYYGFLANRTRQQKLTECRRLLSAPPPPPAVQAARVATDPRLGSHNQDYEIRELGVREGPCGCRTWKYTHFAARPGSMEVNGEVNGR